MDINYKNLRPLDIVLCTSLYPLSNSIRWEEAGLNNIFNTNIVTHCGMLVDIGGFLFISEMVGRLQINSLKRVYLNQGYFGHRIVEIRRNSVFDDPKIRYDINQSIISDYFQTIDYDYKGVISYLLPFVHPDAKKYYCSEYVEKKCTEAGKPIIKNDKLYITPFQIQESENLQYVENWKSD
jgi:hypothetical protein